eukprot:m51a1_g11497 hypothetical protein (121) ;mRNA; f:2860-3473
MHTKEELEAMNHHCSIWPIMHMWDWLEPIEELTYLHNMMRNKHEKAVQGAHLATESTLFTEDFEDWASTVKAPYMLKNISIWLAWTQPEELTYYLSTQMMSDRCLETGLSMIAQRGTGLV